MGRSPLYQTRIDRDGSLTILDGLDDGTWGEDTPDLPKLLSDGVLVGPAGLRAGKWCCRRFGDWVRDGQGRDVVFGE